MSYINAKKNYTTTGAKAAIPLNRWASSELSVEVDVGTTGTYTVEGTLDQVNRAGVTPVWFTITGMSALTADTAQNIANTPMEAIRINIAVIDSTIDFHVMQNA